MNALFDLTGRLALITGSSQGIGYALADGYAAAGAAVVLNGRNQQKLERAKTSLQEKGYRVFSANFDVTDRKAVGDAIDQIENDIGAIDILVNNAGMQQRGPLEEFPEDGWHKLMSTNLDSVFFVGQAVARAMIPRQSGKIINVCSVQSELGRTTIAPYTASKGAVKMLTKGMCADWAKHNIQVNGIGPGYFATELNQKLVDDPEFSDWLTKRTPAARWGNVEELIGAGVFLASSASNFVNGHILYVDGGLTSTL